VLDGHGQNGTQSSLLAKVKIPTLIVEQLAKAKEAQKGVISEPDPEEKDE
jgi:hypothetical protein